MEVLFSSPHWSSDMFTPSAGHPFLVKGVAAVKVTRSRLYLTFDTVPEAEKVGQYLCLPQYQCTENVLEILAIDGRWNVNYKFYDDLEVTGGEVDNDAPSDTGNPARYY